MRSSQDGGGIENERKSEAGGKRGESVNKTERWIRDIKRKCFTVEEISYLIKQNKMEKINGIWMI